MIESLSLVDAVRPDVVESRKQALSKNAQVKTENTNTNGEESTSTMREFLFYVLIKHVLVNPDVYEHLVKSDLKTMLKKGENSGNQYLLLFQHCFIPYQKQV